MEKDIKSRAVAIVVAGGKLSMTFTRVLCGVDFSQASVRAFETAVELAQPVKAELHILHVIEADPVVADWFPVRGVEDVVIALEEKARTAMEALVAPSATACGDIPVTTEVTTGRAFVEILHRSRLFIGENGPSDSALAAASGWRLLAAQPLTGTRRAALLGTCARAAPLGAIRPRVHRS